MAMQQQLTPHLMFQDGRAEEAMNFYVSTFGGEVIMLQHYGAEAPEREGKVQLAIFNIAGLQLNIMDSPVAHDFDFTPSMSLSFQCETEEQFDRIYAALSTDGQTMMPKSDYGFGPYAWLNDRFGVSWQLSFAPDQSKP